MRFVLEEASWAWDGEDREAYIERIEQLLDRLDVARERDEHWAASSELLQQRVLGAHKLMDLLWDPELPLNLPPEVSQRVAAVFSSLRCWDEDDGLPWPSIEATVAGRDVVSPSAAFAHARVAGGAATACLALPGTWSGPCEVVVGGRKEIIHFVVDERSHRAFFRDALIVERADEVGLEALAPHAFPDLFFLEGVWDGLRHFNGGYARVRDDLHRFLAVLDDHGAWVFTDATGRLSPQEPVPVDRQGKPVTRPITHELVERRFRGWSLEVAPENSDVQADGTCRRARERMLGRRKLYCEWHYKFERHTNRAHIHGPVSESGGKVIVAIFRDHLPLPGDR
ncbi:hypothetical protein [Sorangium sp. So ce854]|uniref:hypothetical protein n=1 Tax=Sorangium sp. So ce854 TaxID=3133322 RepID=UPI003F5DD331